jgi:hypothetical protein
MRSTRSRTSSQIAGLPPAERWRYVHFLRTSSRCHRRSICGRTRTADHRWRGRTRLSATINSLSRRRRRGRDTVLPRHRPDLRRSAVPCRDGRERLPHRRVVPELLRTSRRALRAHARLATSDPHPVVAPRHRRKGRGVRTARCSRYGTIIEPVPVATAVAASAAYHLPGMSPADRGAALAPDEPSGLPHMTTSFSATPDRVIDFAFESLEDAGRCAVWLMVAGRCRESLLPRESRPWPERHGRPPGRQG